MVAVVLRSIGKSGIIGAVGLGIEHARLLAVARHALALQIGDMRRHRRGAEGAALMARDPRLHHDATAGREQPVAAEGKPAAPESRAAKAGRLAGAGLRSGMARLLRGAQHLVDEALGLAGAGAADAARPNAEILAGAAHRRNAGGAKVGQCRKSH